MAHMSYKLFIDDERFPPDDGKFWRIARSMDQVKDVLTHFGFPKFVSFDHDLGENQPTGFDIAKWFVEVDLDYHIIPSDFDFYTHSQNPIGAKNITELLRSYLKQR